MLANPDIERLQALDEQEWSRLQQTYWRRIYYYARNFISDHQAAEDVVQDTFLGAVRGIDGFDRRYNIEQYLFGIARNRVIDHLRRNKIPTRPNTAGDEDEHLVGMDVLARDERTASHALRRREDADRRRDAMVAVLKDLVSELWEGEDLTKLKVLEMIFVKGARNKDIWRRFRLQDEKAVAGIKFRCIQRLKELARARDPGQTLFPGLWRDPYR